MFDYTRMWWSWQALAWCVHEGGWTIVRTSETDIEFVSPDARAP